MVLDSENSRHALNIEKRTTDIKVKNKCWKESEEKKKNSST